MQDKLSGEASAYSFLVDTIGVLRSFSFLIGQQMMHSTTESHPGYYLGKLKLWGCGFSLDSLSGYRSNWPWMLSHVYFDSCRAPTRRLSIYSVWTRHHILAFLYIVQQTAPIDVPTSIHRIYLWITTNHPAALYRVLIWRAWARDTSATR